MFTYGWENSARLWFPCIDSFSEVARLSASLVGLLADPGSHPTGVHVETGVHRGRYDDGGVLRGSARGRLHH